METPRVLVLGIGNILMLDEGVGNRVAEELTRHYVFPPDVQVMDAGTMGLGMLHLFKGVDFLLVADAVDGTSYPPGTVIRLAPEDFAPNQVLHSLHDVKFVDVLNAARLINIMPDAECIGIQIENMSPPEFTIGLTDSVKNALPRAVAAALYILEEHDVRIKEATGGGADRVFQHMVALAKTDIERNQQGRT